MHRTGATHLVPGGRAGTSARHEFDDVLPGVAAFVRTEFVFEDSEHWAVEFLRLRDAQSLLRLDQAAAERDQPRTWLAAAA